MCHSLPSATNATCGKHLRGAVEILLRRPHCAGFADAAVSAMQSREGSAPCARTAAISAFAASKWLENAGSACSLRRFPLPRRRACTTSLCQWTLQTLRLSPYATPRARIASARSGAISVSTSPHAQPTAVCPDGYEPSFASTAWSRGVPIGLLVASERTHALVVILRGVGEKTDVRTCGEATRTDVASPAR